MNIHKGKTMKTDPRFAAKVGAEYRLFPLAVPHYEGLQRRVSELTAAYCSPTARILEIGCGTGLTTIKLRQAMPTATIVALDAEEVMIDQITTNLADQNIEVVLADALEYLRQQPEASFDAIVTAFCLHNLPADYRLACFQEMGRVLRPGGVIVQGDKVAQDDILQHWTALKTQIDAFAIFATTDYPELQEEWTAHYLADDRIRLTEAEQRGLFAAAGCQEITRQARWVMDTIWTGIKS